MDIVEKLRRWRPKMEQIGGWKKELTSVPAGGVREIIKDAESAADEIERLRTENEKLSAVGGVGAIAAGA